MFLCPYDVEGGEDEDDGGIAAADVRLDGTLQEPGDVLHYLYDYGDNWELTLRLEKILPGAPDSPSASAIDGRRAAPPGTPAVAPISPASRRSSTTRHGSTSTS